MVQSFELRIAEADELGRVAKLVGDLYHYQGLQSDRRKPTEEELRNELIHRDESSNKMTANKFGTYTVVAVDPSRLDEPGQAYIVGVMIYIHSYSIINGRYIYLTTLFVEESYRRSGLGQAFMEYLRLEGLALGTQVLDVAYINNNYKAQKFYAKYGSYCCNQSYELLMKKIDS